MTKLKAITLVLTVSIFLINLVGCGGEKKSTKPDWPIYSEKNSYILLESDGKYYNYTHQNSLIEITESEGNIDFSIKGDRNELWLGTFIKVPSNSSPFQVGKYDFSSSRLSNSEAHTDWTSFEYAICTSDKGSYEISKVTYDNGKLSAINIEFTLYCSPNSPDFHGKIHWFADDPSAPGPIPTIPTELWKPDPTKTPSTGSYAYIETSGDNSIGLKNSYLYTRFNADMRAYGIDDQTSQGRIYFNIHGDQERWGLSFKTMDGLKAAKAGYYPDLKKYLDHDTSLGSLDWTNINIHCESSSGWVAIDNIAYKNENLAFIDLRFEYKCDDNGYEYKGAIHFEDDTKIFSAGEWSADSNLTPDSGNYIYLKSILPDYIGQNKDYLYTQKDSVINVSVNKIIGSLKININGMKNGRVSSNLKVVLIN